VSFDAITLCVASQRVIPKVREYFVIDSVRKLLDTPSYVDYSGFKPLVKEIMNELMTKRETKTSSSALLYSSSFSY
jgi:hypothetical protein